MSLNNLSVIGAGTMGRGIASVAALAGYVVTLHDVSQDKLYRSLSVIEQTFQDGVRRGNLTSEQVGAAVERISLTTELEMVAQSDIVIEAILENIEQKIKLFKDLDHICRPRAVLASNTSALSITELGAATSRPEQVVGMHFFNPVHRMKLVEIVRGVATSDETCRFADQVAARMGKETVTVNESPGFITTRLNVLLGNEAMNMLAEGVSTAGEIDKAARLGLNHPMGPLELADLVGLDVRLKILEYLHQSLGEKFRPSPLLVKLVKAGRLGRKTGHGFYLYPVEGGR